MLDIVCDALELLNMDRLLSYAAMQALASGVAGMLFDLVCNPTTLCTTCMHARSAFAHKQSHHNCLEHPVQALLTAISRTVYDEAVVYAEVAHPIISFLAS